jgi:hypothetical protein
MPELSVVEIETASRSNIKFATIAPRPPPAICAAKNSPASRQGIPLWWPPGRRHLGAPTPCRVFELPFRFAADYGL